MKCFYCGKKTDALTNDEIPICQACAFERNLEPCTKTGKYKDFECSHICNDCELVE